jgi:2-dehydro-3-deoxyphosphogalactonate aldolase
MTSFSAHLEQLPLIAILRGLRPEEAVAVGHALADAGFGLIEVPLNSPHPFASIERLANALGSSVLVGAGTVLDPADVRRIADAGGGLVVSPHMDPQVIHAARAAGLASVPGIATPTEALAAIAAGADALKLFPAEMLTPSVLKALKAVLPADVPLLPVGGISPDNMAAYAAAGAAGFGIGSALYKPGMTVEDIGAAARRFVSAFQGRARRESPLHGGTS